MARRGDRIYLRSRTWWWLVVVAFLFTVAAAEAGFDRTEWLALYDSPIELAKLGAVAYVLGMVNGLTIAEAMDCGRVELSGEQVAATVAEIVRSKGLELKVAVPLSLVVHHKCRAAPNSVFDRARR